MVEVFKTDIKETSVADHLIFELLLLFPVAQINFDLEDCDHILRIKAKSVCIKTVQKLFSEKGIYCEPLAD